MEEEIKETPMRPKKKKITRHRQAVGWLRKPRKGEKRLLEQRDPQQQHQEPLGSETAPMGKSVLCR